jgi:hypothetical protein
MVGANGFLGILWRVFSGLRGRQLSDAMAVPIKPHLRLSAENRIDKPENRIDKPVRAVLCGLVFLTNIIAAYLALAPLAFSMPDYGLDASWRAVLGEAAVHGWRFGSDIIFTFGPRHLHSLVRA